jgi:predicted acylesterase/phospholipase RssA
MDPSSVNIDTSLNTLNIAVLVLISVVGILIAAWTISYLTQKKGRRQALLDCRVAAKEELPAVHAYCLSKFGDQISDLEAMVLWHERNTSIFEILTGAKTGKARPTDIEGYFSLLPLTDEARHGVNKGAYAGATLPPEGVTADENATALYIGGAAANTRVGSTKVMLRLMARLQSFENVKVIYTRPITQDGLKWVKQSQFARVDGHSEHALGYLYKKDLESPPASLGRMRPKRAPRSKKKTTRFFQTSYGTFQGGGCRAAAYVGAYAEAVARGVHFVEVAGTSAGSIIAVLIAAGATPLQLREIVSRLDFSDLLALSVPVQKSIGIFWRPFLRLISFIPHRVPKFFASTLMRNGQYSSEKLQDWVERELKQLLQPSEDGHVRFKHLHLPVSVVAADLLERKVQVWSSHTTKDFEVAAAVCASCSIPFFFQPFENRYVDGGTLSNLPTFVFNKKDRPRQLSLPILAFTLKADFEEAEMARSLGLVSAVVNTMVDGSQELQQRVQENIHTISIPTGKIKATDFMDMNSEKVARLAKNGQLATRVYLDNEIDRIHLKSPSSVECMNREEVFAVLVERCNQCRKNNHIIVAFDDLDWVDELASALLHARLKQAQIRVVCSAELEPGSVDYHRTLLLRSIGCTIGPSASVRLKGCLFGAADPQNSFVFLQSGDQSFSSGVLYSGRADLAAVKCFAASFAEPVAPNQKSLALQQCTQKEIEILTARLQQVAQYGHEGVMFEIEDVPLEKLRCLTKYVQEHKYKQACAIAEIYQENDVPLFRPACLISGEERPVFLLPPIVEKDRYSGNYYVVDGLARTLASMHSDLPSLACMVVTGVVEPLPSLGRFAPEQIQVISRPLGFEERYEDYDRQRYRLLPLAIECRSHLSLS